MAIETLLFGNGGGTLLGVTWTWTGIASVLYILRACYASRESSHDHASFFGIRWDFLWVTIAYIAALLAQITTTVSYLKADSNHQQLQGIFQGLKPVLLTAVISNISALSSMIFGRFAVIALLLLLQGNLYSNWKKVLWVIGSAQAMVIIAQIIIIINECSPIRKLWDIEVYGSCDLIDFNQKFGYVSGSIGAAADFSLAIYPSVFIIGPLMKLPFGLRIGVCCILGGGVFAGIAGIVKMAKLADVGNLHSHYADYEIWVLTEMWFIIIFGTIATIRPVFLTIGRGVNRMSMRIISKDKPPRQSTERPRNFSEPISLEPFSRSSMSKSRGTVSEDKIIFTEAPPRARRYKPWSMDFDLEMNREAYRSRYGPLV